MVQAYLTSEPGVTHGLSKIKAAIEEFRQHLIVVIHLTHNDTYSFIAIFREPNSIGNFTALINQDGSSRYGGTGSRGHEEMLAFLDNNTIEIDEADWDDWQSDYPDFIRKLSLPNDQAFLNDVWGKFLSAYIWHYLPSK